MNSSTKRAWALLASGLGLAAGAYGQFENYLFLCDDPSTTASNLSANFALMRQRNDLFGVSIGVSGTVNFERCFGNPGVTLGVSGRIGFQIGTVGSIQDEAIFGRPIDDNLMLNAGMPFIAGNFGYAKIVTADEAGALTFGDFTPTSFWTGGSDRYIRIGAAVNSVNIVLRCDLIGDAARMDWALSSTDARRMGLWFGQWVVGNGPEVSGQFLYGKMQSMSYIRIPGRRPIRSDTRLVNNATSDQIQMPPYVDFGLTQGRAFGLRVVTLPTEGTASALADQTPVDFMEIADAGVLRSPNLLGSQLPAGDDRPMSDAFSFSFFGEDITFSTPPGSILPWGTGYIQRWQPVLTTSRRIVAYYKSTTGESNFTGKEEGSSNQIGYAAVVDAPKTIGVEAADPNQFDPNIATIRVYIDNTGGFSDLGTAINMNDAQVTLQLPQGMSDANDPAGLRTEITKFTGPILANDADIVDPSLPLAYVDFQVRINPNVFGQQTYRVTIDPDPGPVKVVTGTINVASQPRIALRGGSAISSANLVTVPWTFSDNSWSTILGPELRSDVDYQTFTWDAQLQDYVLQTGAQRSRGTWVIYRGVDTVRPLAGNPRIPSDFSTGAPLIRLYKGWNLIANPYNYAIEIGQIVGVPGSDGESRSYRFDELVSQDIISGSLAYWDPNTQSYKFTSTTSDTLQPNTGYWIFVNTTQPVTLSMPPVFASFIPPGSGIARSSGWSLNLVARTATAVDDQNFAKTVLAASQVKQGEAYEPPMAPVKGAVSAFFSDNGKRLAASNRLSSGRMEWTYSVVAKDAGNVTISWPNLATLPSKLKLTMTDTTTGLVYDLRRSPNVTFAAGANATRNFRLVAEAGVATSLIGDASVERARSATAPAVVRYQLNDRATTTVRILNGTREVARLLVNRTEAAGSKSLNWNLRDAANRPVASGVYTAEIRAVSGASSETRLVSFRYAR